MNSRPRSSRRSLASVLLFALAALCLTGCVSTAGNPSVADSRTVGQRLLDKYLSPGFTGDLNLREQIPLYLTVTLEGANLRREESGWKYDWIEYNRNGPFGTSAHIRLGKRP